MGSKLGMWAEAHGVGCHPVSHTTATQWVENYQVWPNWVCYKGRVNQLDVWAASKN